MKYKKEYMEIKVAYEILSEALCAVSEDIIKSSLCPKHNNGKIIGLNAITIRTAIGACIILMEMEESSLNKETCNANTHS